MKTSKNKNHGKRVYQIEILVNLENMIKLVILKIVEYITMAIVLINHFILNGGIF